MRSRPCSKRPTGHEFLNVWSRQAKKLQLTWRSNIKNVFQSCFEKGYRNIFLESIVAKELYKMWTQRNWVWSARWELFRKMLTHRDIKSWGWVVWREEEEEGAKVRGAPHYKSASGCMHNASDEPICHEIATLHFLARLFIVWSTRSRGILEPKKRCKKKLSFEGLSQKRLVVMAQSFSFIVEKINLREVVTSQLLLSSHWKKIIKRHYQRGRVSGH